MKLPTLERYNQMVWAAVGTGVIVLVAIGILAAAAALLYAVIKDDSSGIAVALVDDTGTDDSQRNPARYDFCHPVAADDSPYQLIQVVSDRLIIRNASAKLEKQAAGSYSYEADTYNSCSLHGSKDPTAIVNVLVRHADTGAMRVVLKENVVVQTLEYPQPANQENHPDVINAFPPKGVLYWEIASEDSNEDGVIDEEDDVGAYLSDIDGKNMARITPKPSRVLQKTYDKKRNALLLRILPDTNRDGNLDDNDTPSLIESSVAHRKIIREIVDNKTLAKVMFEAEPKRQEKQTARSGGK